MKKPTQRDTNPYRFSDSNKRYQTFDYYARSRFGKKCAKIPLDAGLSCPNIESAGSGCIYCLGGSSAAIGETLTEQYERGVSALGSKWHDFARIPYLQAHTNTFAPVPRLREIYKEAAALDGAVMLAIATRADCLGDDVCALIREVSESVPLLVELGLQTSCDRTADLIGRGHSSADFVRGYERLRSVGGDIAVCIHLINGLPGESRREMLDSAKFCAALAPDMVKLHLLHVLDGTPLADMYRRGEYVPMEMDDYVETVADQIERMPERTVIARLTGDGIASALLAPDWSRRKVAVINKIDRTLYERGTYQGCRYSEK